MAEASGQSLAFAAAVALSPVPIIAVIVILVTPRARTNAPAFLFGWLVGLALVGAVALLVTGPLDAGSEEGPAPWIGALELALGGIFVLMGIRAWRGRPVEGGEVPEPAWMRAIGSLTAPKALGAGAGLAGVNPSNLLLAVAAAAAITKAGVSAGAQAAAYAVFALVATIGVATPVGLYFVLGDRAAPVLARMRRTLTAHSAVIMAVLCLLIGVTLIGDAIAGLGA